MPNNLSLPCVKHEACHTMLRSFRSNTSFFFVRLRGSLGRGLQLRRGQRHIANLRVGHPVMGRQCLKTHVTNVPCHKTGMPVPPTQISAAFGAGEISLLCIVGYRWYIDVHFPYCMNVGHYFSISLLGIAGYFKSFFEKATTILVISQKDRC